MPVAKKIPPDESIEKLETLGWKIFNEFKDAYWQCSGILRVIEANYWRQRDIFSRDKLVKRHTRLAVGRKYHPSYVLDIDHYTKHWLYAMREKLSGEVIQAMQDQWGYSMEQCKYLPDGCSIYQFNEEACLKENDSKI